VVRTVSGRIEAYHARRPGAVFPVKQQQFYACSAAGEHAKIDATVPTATRFTPLVVRALRNESNCSANGAGNLAFKKPSITCTAFCAFSLHIYFVRFPTRSALEQRKK
jgi:hypothetical protein